MILNKKIICRKNIVILFLLFNYMFFSMDVRAAESVNYKTNDENIANDEILNIGHYIPNDIIDVLPDGIVSNDYQTVVDSYYEISDPEYIYQALVKALKGSVLQFLKLCGRLIGILVISVILKEIGYSSVVGGMKMTYMFCSDIVIFSVLLGGGLKGLNEATMYIDSLNLFISGLVPATATLYAVGGNIKTAIVSSTGFITFLSVSNYVCNIALKFILTASLIILICSVLTPKIKLKQLSDTVKKTFIIVVSFIMILLLFSMSAQNFISAAADSLSARTAKFVVGNMIPLVGGSISETVRTLGTSIAFLKKTIGIGSVIVIIIMIMPHLTGLFLTRTAYSLVGAISNTLGCEREGDIMREISSIYGYIIAVTAMCTVMFIFALTLFAGSAVAIL